MQNPISGAEQSQITDTSAGPLYESGRKMSFAYHYDAAKDPLTGLLYLRGEPMPKGFIVTGASYLDVTLGVTSGGAATVSLGVETTTDLRTAQTLATAPALSAIAVVDLVTNPAFAEETTFIKCTAPRRPSMTIAVAALLVGKFTLILEGNLPS